MLLSVEGLDVRFGVYDAGRQVCGARSQGPLVWIRRGTTLALVGESGSGKSTVAGALTGLVKPGYGGALDHLMAPTFFACADATRRRCTDASVSCCRTRSHRWIRARESAWPSASHFLCTVVKGRRGRQHRVAELLDFVGLAG